MTRLNWITDFTRDRRSFAPEGDGAGGDTTTTTTATGDTTQTTATNNDTTQTQTQTNTAKWWEGDRFADPARQYLTAKGLTLDDPMEAMPKLVDIAANAEKRIGKGLDTILDKPGKDEPYADWVARNREALNLPKDEAGYEVARPENWPKDAPWNDASEAKAKAIALKYGIPKEALQELVSLQAEDALQTYAQAEALGEEAKRKLWQELEKDYGDQVPKVMQQARRGAEAVAEKAGLTPDIINNMSDTLTDKIGDPNVIRFMAAIGDMLGDDTALGLGKSGALTTTPAEARAQLAALRAPGGAYYEATAKRDNAAIERLRPQIDNLTRIAAGR